MMMRIFLINYEFPPFSWGGGRASAQIARELASQGHEVVVMTSALRGLARKEYKDGYLILRIPALRRHREKCSVPEMIIFMISAIIYSIDYVRHWRPDTTIAFFTLPSGPAAYLLKKIYGIPYLISLRGGDVPGFMKEQLWIYHRLALGWIRTIWRGAKGVVANSNGLKELALHSSRGVGISVIPNGVESQSFQRSTVRHKNEGDPLRILTVGRLTAQKGIDVLLFAFAELKKRTTKQLQLWIVGGGPSRRELERLAIKLGMTSDVFFYGWQDHSQLHTFYSSADLFVLSSLDEGMPNVLLEAMAAGLACIATTVAGSQEIIQNGENGVLVPTRNPQILAEKMENLIMDAPLRERLSKAALATIHRYSWQEVATTYLKICQAS